METKEIGISPQIKTMDIMVVGIGVDHIHETMAELALRGEHPNLIVVSGDNIAYNGTGIQLTKEQEREILIKAIPMELKPNPNPDLVKDLIEIKPIECKTLREPRKSDNQPWAKCNRRRKY